MKRMKRIGRNENEIIWIFWLTDLAEIDLVQDQHLD